MRSDFTWPSNISTASTSDRRNQVPSRPVTDRHIAHDIRNILAIISNSLDLIEIGIKEVESSEFLEHAREAIKRGWYLTDSMASHGRVHQRSPEKVCPRYLVNSLAPLLNRLVPVNITLKLKTDKPCPKILVDRNALENAIINLVVNARDAIDNYGNIEIEVMAERINLEYTASGPLQMVLIEVRDDGLGMSPETLERCCDEFFTSKGETGGSGLGLFNVNAFCNSNAGSLNIQSTVGRGTSVTIILPAL